MHIIKIFIINNSTLLLIVFRVTLRHSKSAILLVGMSCNFVIYRKDRVGNSRFSSTPDVYEFGGLSVRNMAEYQYLVVSEVS